MAKRKPFKRDVVGTARFDLKVAQERKKHRPTGQNIRAVERAEKNLLTAINVRKGRVTKKKPKTHTRRRKR
jgi:hypothetical protein